MRRPWEVGQEGGPEYLPVVRPGESGDGEEEEEYYELNFDERIYEDLEEIDYEFYGKVRS